MSAEKLERARTLLKSKQYDEAAVLLRGMDHPTAREWLQKIEARGNGKQGDRRSVAAQVGKMEAQLKRLEDDIESRKGQKRSATIVFIGSLILSPVGVGLVLLPFSLFNYYRHGRALKKLQGQRNDLTEEIAAAKAELY